MRANGIATVRSTIARMYATSEEARSDLFLAGAVYLFGPLLLQIATPLFRIPVLGYVLVVIAPLLTTALVPFLLMRYRKETVAEYGLGDRRGRGMRMGALLALPVVAGAALGVGIRGGLLPATLPATLFDGSQWLGLAANITTWAGLTTLAVYSTVKARDAFRADIRTVPEGVTEIARILGIVAGIATLLLLVGAATRAFPLDPLLVVLLPLGVAGAVLLLLRRHIPSSTTTRAALLTPAVLLALRPFNPFALFFNAGNFVLSVWSAALLAAIGLIMAATLESRRSAWPAVALGAMLALLVPVSFVAG
jgi:hypothetical protein